jgi:23S rRNA (adenine2030-N6)-methyltransferase
MNYRHAFHAGNFADVVKHAVLALVLRHLARKDAPLRVIDTHAGIGLYDLAGEQAQRTGEWRAGIGRLDGRPLPPSAQAILQPYRDAVAVVRALRGAAVYPGSPMIAAEMARAQDRLVFIEKHPQDVQALRAAIGRDRRVRVVALDGWTALKAYVPPVERRGLVLVDPPFEEAGEFERMAATVHLAWTKWPTGVYMLWYPIKDLATVGRFHADMRGRGIARVLRIEVEVRAPTDPRQLNGCGLVVINPPWTLPADMQALLPELSERLGVGGGAGWRCDWIAGDRDRA